MWPFACPDRRTDHEVELAFVIGRKARNVPRAEALQYLAGYSVGLDISIRGPEDAKLPQVARRLFGDWPVAGHG